MANKTEKLSIAEVERRVEAIRVDSEGDYESAHADEDALHVAVLRTIAVTMIVRRLLARRLARAALKTVEIEFMRHCS